MVLAEGKDAGNDKSWSESQSEATAARPLEKTSQVTTARLLTVAQKERALDAHYAPFNAGDTSAFRVT